MIQESNNTNHKQELRGGFISSMITIGWFTLAYRISSIIRDIIVASVMGAGIISDVFAVIFKLINILRKIFSEGAFNASFLPKFTYVLKENGKKAAEHLGSQIFSWLFLILSILTFICLWRFEDVISIYAPTFIGTEKFKYAVELGRISFPYVTASFIVALLSGVLNSINKFSIPAASHLILNFLIIIALFCPTFPFQTHAHNVAYAICAAGMIQVLILWFNTKYNGFKVTLTKDLISPNVKEIFVKMIPGAIGAGVWQINMLIDVCMASQLATGCVSYLYYMDHINQFPISLFGISLSTGMLPYITKSFKEEKFNNANYEINRGIVFALAWSIPLTMISITIPEAITSLFYEGGKFTKEDVILAAPCLSAFALGLPAYTLTKICSTAFFAKKETKSPLISGILAIILNYIMIQILKDKYQHTGIAFATTIAAWFNGLYLYIVLIVRKEITIYKKTIIKLIKQLILAGIVSFIAYSLKNVATPYLSSKLSIVSIISSILILSGFIFNIVGKKISCFNDKNQ